MRNTDVTGGKPIVVLLQSISGASAINPFAFYDIHGKERCYSFILSRTPHEVKLSLIKRAIFMYLPKYKKCINMYLPEEFDGRAVSALGVRSRKLSTGLNGQS
jgi:hypothetical protein